MRGKGGSEGVREWGGINQGARTISCQGNRNGSVHKQRGVSVHKHKTPTNTHTMERLNGIHTTSTYMYDQ